MKNLAVLQQLLARMRALFFIHWTAHWQASGPQEYGDHQLFSRLYEAIDDEIDGLAEKMVASFGNDAVDLNRGVLQMAKVISSTPGKGVARCLAAEKAFQTWLKAAYEELEKSGDMSLGMDNFLQGIADKHETHVYLLQQRVRGQGG